jgi:hypothetical protein
MMDAKNWYKNCGDAIRKEFGNDADLFIDLLAATSPQKHISANWRLAMRIYHIWTTKNPVLEGWKENEIFSQNLFAGTLPAHRYNIMRALKGEPLSGNKVKAFAANLKGDLEQVTIDRWVQRWYDWPGYTKTLSNIKYNKLAQYIKEQATNEGYKPAEWQAIIWHKAREKSRKKPSSYLSMMNKNQLYFEFYYQ